MQARNRVAALLLLNATLGHPTRANIEVDRAIRERRFLEAHTLTAEGSTVSMREMALSQANSNSDAYPLFNEADEYVKSLCQTLARRMSSSPLKEEALCDSCLHSVSRILSGGKRTFNKIVSVESLQKSIRAYDCSLCASILECILANGTINDEVVYETVISGDEEEVVVDVDIVEQSFNTLSSIVITHSGNPFVAESDLNHTGSDISMVSILTNLVDCLACHPHCTQIASELPKLPTRVIDVGPPDSSENPVLLVTEGSHGRYVTLSHRWAGSMITRTLQDNFQSRCRSIPWEELTKTMQDAVTITRALGIRYLWIDSLCIIQDSREDWLKQAPKMSGIYHNCVVSIAADCAHDHSQSFFTSSFRKRKIVEVPIESSSRRCSIDYKMKPQEHVSALDQRGWILQEQLLSPRILKFCQGKIEWECLTSGSSPFKRAMNGVKSTSMDLRSQAYSSWHEIAASYSARILTHKSDKIMALMGIADYTGAAVNDSFLAGLWKDNLWHDLLWSSNRRHGRLDFKLPTWSWVSIDGPVQYTWPNKSLPARATCLIETVSCEIRNCESGIHGRLILRAGMHKVHLDPNGLLNVSSMTRNRPLGSVKYGRYQREGAEHARWSSDISLESVDKLVQPLWLMEIARDRHLHCLCVVNAGSSLGPYEQFERVGICSIDATRVARLGELQTIMLV